MASEGDTLYVPCLNFEEYDISIWGINGILYSLTNLPLSHNVLHEGILLPDASTDRGGSYTCYRRSGDGYDLLLISNVRLDVRSIFIGGEYIILYYDYITICMVMYAP